MRELVGLKLIHGASNDPHDTVNPDFFILASELPVGCRILYSHEDLTGTNFVVLNHSNMIIDVKFTIE